MSVMPAETSVLETEFTALMEGIAHELEAIANDLATCRAGSRSSACTHQARQGPPSPAAKSAPSE